MDTHFNFYACRTKQGKNLSEFNENMSNLFQAAFAPVSQSHTYFKNSQASRKFVCELICQN